MRTLLAYLIIPFMKLTGYRFPKYHRQENTLVYRMIDVVTANLKSGL